MRNKLSVISQQIKLDGVDTLNLPRNSVHDAYILRFNIKTHATAAATVTPREVLEAISEIRLVTDSTRVHYALNGHDLALLNARIQVNSTAPFIDSEPVSMQADDTHDYDFSLYLDEGDILAVLHTNVELTVKFAHQVKANVEVLDANAKITIKESIYSTQELASVFGKDFENVAEPKVYSQTASCNANSEFTGFFDLPTGTLLRGAMLFVQSAGAFPDQMGILRTVPDRIELNKEDFETHLELDQIIYKTVLPVDRTNHTAAYVMDFGTQWQANNLGKNAWSYAKGDVQLAAKTSAALNIRYISLESMVNTAVYDKTVSFTEY